MPGVPDGPERMSRKAGTLGTTRTATAFSTTGMPPETVTSVAVGTDERTVATLTFVRNDAARCAVRRQPSRRIAGEKSVSFPRQRIPAREKDLPCGDDRRPVGAGHVARRSGCAML